MNPVKKPEKRQKHIPQHYVPDTTPKIAAVGAGILVLLVLLSFALSSGWANGKSTGIILPGSEGDTPDISTGSALFTAQNVLGVEVTTDNAQTIIETLARPSAYRCEIENTIYYKGGSAALTCRRYARDGVLRTDTVNAEGQVQSTLVRLKDGTLYAWNAGDSSAYRGKAGDFSDDAAAMLPTYEDVLADDIVLTDAGEQEIGGEPCVAVTFEQDGYRCEYAISTVSGLLRQASFYNGNTLTRRVTVSEVSIETPEGSLFALPDGTDLLR